MLISIQNRRSCLEPREDGSDRGQDSRVVSYWKRHCDGDLAMIASRGAERETETKKKARPGWERPEVRPYTKTKLLKVHR
jgi:hypothetical protein